MFESCELSVEITPAEVFFMVNPPPTWISRVFDPRSCANFQNPISRGSVDFSGTTRWKVSLLPQSIIIVKCQFVLCQFMLHCILNETCRIFIKYCTKCSNRKFSFHLWVLVWYCHFLWAGITMMPRESVYLVQNAVGMIMIWWKLNVKKSWGLTLTWSALSTPV